ncbi:MAG: hypothetical protein O3C27_17030 [Actinomycetota bacterium]|nr:hypothetical protein [Actinomycetota bacterium]
MQQPIEGIEITTPENGPGIVQNSGAEPTTSLTTTSLKGALALIDQGLGGLTDRQLVSASEVTDLLLDVRSLLVATA